LLAAAAVVSCATARFTGALDVDGRPFVARACRAGYNERFYGVDLTDAEGRVLRLGYTEKPSGVFPYPRPGVSRPSFVAFKPRDGAEWEDVGPCGPLLIQRQGKGGVDGDMKLRCLSARHAIEGRLAFENCY
jgi:hypothetical protein